MSHSIWHHLTTRVRDLADQASLGELSRSRWLETRPTLHAEFMQNVGLDPLPPRCELRVTDYGGFEGEGYRARRIAFQILPDCWASANIYYPATTGSDGAAPAVLYVCGHAPSGTYHYQPHGMMWARRGYVCLILDTIEQSDNPGEHHGSLLGQFDHWLALGYTATTGELWNSLRALDVLVADPAVDPQRVGVTGVSGGGALSFFVAIADERVRAVSALCGLSPTVDAIANRRLMNNCDCFYPLNLHPRDISTYAAVIAPRPALFCFAEQDQLFTLDEVRRTIDRTRQVYEVLGDASLCELVTCPGRHGDHPEFDDATARLFDRHVAQTAHPAKARGSQEQAEGSTSVFQGRPPLPNHVHLLPELLSPAGSVALPENSETWTAVRSAALEDLTQRVPELRVERLPPATWQLNGSDYHWGPATRMDAHRGDIGGIEVWMHTVADPGSDHPFVLCVAGEGETSMHALSRVGCAVDPSRMGYGGFEPRMAGFTASATRPAPPPPGSRFTPARTALLRAMALAGTSPVVMTVQDLRIAVHRLLGQPHFARRPVYLYGQGDGAAAVLYTALLDERIAGVIAEDLPHSHRQGAPIPGILRMFDLPHAVGLMAPRPVTLVTAGHSNWNWPRQVYQRLGCGAKLIMSDSARDGLARMLP